MKRLLCCRNEEDPWLTVASKLKEVGSRRWVSISTDRANVVGPVRAASMTVARYQCNQDIKVSLVQGLLVPPSLTPSHGSVALNLVWCFPSFICKACLPGIFRSARCPRTLIFPAVTQSSCLILWVFIISQSSYRVSVNMLVCVCGLRLKTIASCVHLAKPSMYRGKNP